VLPDGPPVELADFADGAGPGRQPSMPEYQDAVLDAVMQFHQRREQQRQQLLGRVLSAQRHRPFQRLLLAAMHERCPALPLSYDITEVILERITESTLSPFQHAGDRNLASDEAAVFAWHLGGAQEETAETIAGRVQKRRRGSR
jgi:hypothetical protein